MSLIAEGLVCRAAGRRLLDEVSLAVRPGEVHAVLGPNGAGKSTLLRALSGERIVESGGLRLNGRPLRAWHWRDVARQRAVLPQLDQLRFGFTAAEVVALGRLPCVRQAPAREQQIVMAALDTAGVQPLAQRRYPSLSGGERARVQFARVLAQIWEPVALGARHLLLDEPTARLDLAHQHALMTTVRRFAAEGVGVLAVLHDPNLALHYADRVSLLQGGRIRASGPAQQTLQADNLRQLYGIEVDVLSLQGRRWIVPHSPAT